MSFFITFEGGEGSGKSLQASLLKDFLGDRAVLTREPGGTPLAEEIRRTLLIGDPDKVSPLTEALLYMAARSDHWENSIIPHLKHSKIVICDRFHDSGIVYQGVCKNVSIELLNTILSHITNGRLPDRTYLIDIDPQIGVARSLGRKGNIETRFEKLDISFHEKVRQAFLDLANQNSERFLVINGSLGIKEIHKIIKKDIEKFL